MNIQWFPGHMNKARKAIAERMKSTDVVIEVLDARFPASCVSPLLAQSAQGKAQLKILNKSDLADAQRTALWIDYFGAQSKTAAMTFNAHENKGCLKLIEAARALMPHRQGIAKPLRVMICGVPNVGKSTLINSLIGKKSAKTGNEPGITKAEQRLILADDFWLYDTPGMLWQKITIPESGYRLAMGGSVGRNALDEETLAYELLAYLKQHYLSSLQNRYTLPEIHAESADEAILCAIAAKRGAILSGARVDYQKTAEIILRDFRSGSLGNITLETPEEWTGWLKVAQEAEAEQQRQREANQNEH